jgi:hypothetical protein
MSSDADSKARIGSTGMRAAAWVIALVALLGLATNFAMSFAFTGSLWRTAWSLLRYFTITSNLLVLTVFICIGLSGSLAGVGKWMGATVLSIVLVGVVYAVLLSGQRALSGGSLIADVLLHRVTPVLVPMFWLLFMPKGHLTRRDPYLWALYPLCYFAYAMIRGALDGRYAYPFINAARLGWSHVILTAALIALGFFAVGEAFVFLDRRAGRRASPVSE